LYRVVEPLKRLPSRAPAVAWLVTFPVMMAGWIPFRAQSMADSITLFGRVLDPWGYGLRQVVSTRALTANSYLVAATLVLGMLAAHRLRRSVDWESLPLPVRLPAIGLATAVMTGLVLLFQRPIQQFIYFQF